MRVGSGTGPATAAPVRSAASTICSADWSRMRWSNALRRMRIFCRGIALLDDLGDDTSADGAAAFADGEVQALFDGHRLNQLHRHVDVVPRHHHLDALRKADAPRHIRRADVELRPVAL